MNALAAKLSILSALALAAAGCTDMEPGSEDAPEVGTSSAALLAGGTTWTARLTAGSPTIRANSTRWGAIVGITASTHDPDDFILLGPPSAITVERFYAVLSFPVPTARTIKISHRAFYASNVQNIASCVVPAGGTSCSTAAAFSIAADRPLVLGMGGGSVGEPDPDVLVSWTFHEE